MIRYTTQNADTPRKIAIRYYGDPSQYPMIIQSNPALKTQFGKLSADVLILPGQNINIPDILNQDTKTVTEKKDVITLRVGGENLQYFTSINVNIDYDNIANTFSFSCPYDNFEPYKSLFTPFQFQDCEVFVNNTRVISGVVSTVKYELDAQKRYVTLAGYSYSGLLNYSEIPNTLFPLQMNNVSFFDFVRKIIAPFGIKADYAASVSDKMKKKIQYKKPEPNNKIYDLIAAHARDLNIIIQSDERGQLFFTSPDEDQDPVFTIAEGTPTATDFQVEYDSNALYSDYTGLIRYKYENGLFGKISKKVDFINTMRSKTIIGKDITKAQLENLVKGEIGRGFAAAVKISTAIPSWTDRNGNIFKPGTLIEVEYPSCRIETPSLFFVRSVNFNIPPIETGLELIPLGSFSGEVVEFWT